jgi:hypothetical protein
MQVRTPPLLAMAAACVQALVPAREVLVGVGVSSPVVAGDWHGTGYPARPLARMREFRPSSTDGFSVARLAQ